jgi:hypothetical protein
VLARKEEKRKMKTLRARRSGRGVGAAQHDLRMRSKHPKMKNPERVY